MNEVIFKIDQVDVGYMIATTAFHLLGELSRPEGSLCHIHGQSHGYWVGSWVTGMGFVHVLFPKETTRPLTDEEVQKYKKKRVQIASQPSYGFSEEDLRQSAKVIAGMET